MSKFNFTIAHIHGKHNTAAAYLSRLEIDPKEKLVLTLKKAIEVNIQSAGVSEEEQIFYTDEEEFTEQQLWDRKKHARSTPAREQPTIVIEALSVNTPT